MNAVRDAPVPDVRQGYQLYDTTVDAMANPSIYVAVRQLVSIPRPLTSLHPLADANMDVAGSASTCPQYHDAQAYPEYLIKFKQ